LDGFGLLRELRAHEATRTIPVILLSARAGEESAIEGLEASADDYLVKPFSARELLARVRTHLELAKLRQEWALELEAANKELEAFSHSISHDLRSPLRAIGGFGRILLEDFATELSPDALQLLNTIIENGQRMNSMIDDLLRFSQLGRAALSRQRVDLSLLAREVAQEIQSSEAHPPEIRIAELPECICDRSLLRQVLTNLISNGAKFSRRREKPLIEIAARLEKDEIVYFVRDNGAGFDMQYADKLFGVFQRLHDATEFEGTGVGLSIVSRIIGRHGGRVWTEAELNKGATFYFSLPKS